ncbi:major capsid protein [Cytobacillus phage Bfsp1]|nr:major capsid protein [Cytobacillus phage Bfsp1]
MARITFKDVQTTLGINESYDIMNAIRNSGSSQFQQYVPLANADNVAQVGAGILLTSALQNEFITSLVERIGLVVIRQITLKNQLAKFKKGQMPMGRTIEEIFVDLAHEHQFDAEDAEQTVFKRQIPDVKTLFHERNRQGFYKQTIQDDSLKSAFTSWGNFEGFLAGIINALYNSSEVDEFKYMKLLIDNYFSKNLFTIVPVAEPTASTAAATEFIKKLRATALKMTLSSGSREYNSLAVHTRSDMESLHLIIDADLLATVDVDVLAKAFNMDKTNFVGHITVIDGFASSGLEAVLIDDSFFMVYDTLQKMETIRNPQGLYWNYFYHVWQVLSTSRFANAVAFVSGEVAEVTQVIVDPVAGAIKAGKEMTFNAFVRSTDGVTRDVVWTIEGDAGTVIQAGTTINADGKLSVADTQTGQLRIKATVSVDPDGTAATGDEYDVVGEAVVTVTPA